MSSPITRVTGGSLPRIAVGISTISGRRYTLGVPPFVGMRMATPAVRAAPALARLTPWLEAGVGRGSGGGLGGPRVVEVGALDRGEPNGQESEHQAAGQREAHLGVRHGEARPDELVELGATTGRRREALVVDERAGGVAADQVGVPEELW